MYPYLCKDAQFKSVKSTYYKLSIKKLLQNCLCKITVYRLNVKLNNGTSLVYTMPDTKH